MSDAFSEILAVFDDLVDARLKQVSFLDHIQSELANYDAPVNGYRGKFHIDYTYFRGDLVNNGNGLWLRSGDTGKGPFDAKDWVKIASLSTAGGAKPADTAPDLTDVVRHAGADIIDVTVIAPTEMGRIFVVTAAGIADVSFGNLSGRYIPARSMLIRDLQGWYALTGAQLASGDVDLLTFQPKPPLTNGEMYIHRGVTGTIGNAAFLNIQGQTVHNGDVAMFSDEDNKWTLLANAVNTTRQVKSHEGDAIVAGNLYNPILFADGDKYLMTFDLDITEDATGYMNTYRIEVRNRLNAAEIISITEIGSIEHIAYIDAGTFSVSVSSGDVLFEVPTTGSGEALTADITQLSWR